MSRVFGQSAARTVLLLALAFLAALAWADGSVRLDSFPKMSVADGRSSITITAEVRDGRGRTVPNGTQVVFTTTLGSFTDPIAKTSNGIARVTFNTGAVPGTAKIQASVHAYNLMNVLEVELVADRSMLSMANEYIEIVAPKYLMYSTDQKTIGAAAPERGVKLRYREVEISADDLQVHIPTYDVRARNAMLKIGDKVEQVFQELRFTLNKRSGFGLTNVQVPNYELVGQGRLLRFAKTMKERIALANVSREGVTYRQEPVPIDAYDFADLIASESTVSAKKAVAFPRGTIQFHDAEMYLGTNKLVKLPLFQVNMYGSTPLVNEQVINVYENRLAINYPHYLSLKPGETSLLRLRSGERYGRSSSGVGGFFLDYELNWNRGDDMEGGLTVSGLTRKDWSVGARQYWRLSDNTFATAQLDFPAHRSMFGNANVKHRMSGFNLDLNASNSRSLSGPRYASERYSAILERDPIPLGNLPLRLFYGISANWDRSVTYVKSVNEGTTSFERRVIEQESTSARTRLQLLPVNFGANTNLSASLSFSRFFSGNTPSNFSTLGEVSLSHRFNDTASFLLTYNYAHDGFTDQLIGRHSVNLMGTYEAGNTSLAATVNHSLDVDRSSLILDASYRLSSLWRTSYSLTFDRFMGDQYIDDIFMLSYRFGVRELGVTYSIREKRFGFQVFGTQF